MKVILKRVEGWEFTFGGETHSGWLPQGAAFPLPTPIEPEVLDIEIEKIDAGFLLIWIPRLSTTCREFRPPKAGDSWHKTMTEAMDQACQAFGIQQEDWTDVDIQTDASSS